MCTMTGFHPRHKQKSMQSASKLLISTLITTLNEEWDVYIISLYHDQNLVLKEHGMEGG